MSYRKTARLMMLLISLMSVFRSEGADFRKTVSKRDRLAVGRCLRENIEPLFPDTIRPNQSAAEFLGTFCTSLSVREIESKFQENISNVAGSSTTPSTLGQEIARCLQQTGQLIIYSRYLVYGSSLLTEQKKQHEEQVEKSRQMTQSPSEQHDQQPTSDQSMVLVPANPQPASSVPLQVADVSNQMGSSSDHQPSMALTLVNSQPSMALTSVNPQPASFVSSQVADGPYQLETSSDHQQPLALTLVNPHPAGSVSSPVADGSARVESFVHPQSNTSENAEGEEIWVPPNVKDCSEFTLFALGLCNSTEFVDFDELAGDRQKEVLNCSEECVQTFFDRIKDTLAHQIQKIREKQQKEVSGEDVMSFLSNFVQMCKEAGVRNIQQITYVGINWLDIYSSVYDNIYEIYASLSTRDELESMDQELAGSFFDYESCIHWECSLKNGHDEPLYDMLEKNTMTSTKHNLSRALMQKPELEPPTPSQPSDTVEMLANELGPGWETTSTPESNDNNNITNESTDKINNNEHIEHE